MIILVSQPVLALTGLESMTINRASKQAHAGFPQTQAVERPQGHDGSVLSKPNQPWQVFLFFCDTNNLHAGGNQRKPRRDPDVPGAKQKNPIYPVKKTPSDTD